MRTLPHDTSVVPSPTAPLLPQVLTKAMTQGLPRTQVLCPPSPVPPPPPGADQGHDARPPAHTSVVPPFTCPPSPPRC